MHYPLNGQRDVQVEFIDSKEFGIWLMEETLTVGSRMYTVRGKSKTIGSIHRRIDEDKSFRTFKEAPRCKTSTSPG
jgi:hypothetical protein